MLEHNTNSLINAVFDFNERVIKTPVNQPLGPLTQAQFDWTVKAYKEETKEFVEGAVNQDMIKMVDSCLDLVYFAVGTLKKLGLTREQAHACFMAIHIANMRKEKGEVAGRGGDEDAKKPENFVPPDEQIGVILFGAVEDEGI
jgi:predicted HAD superfamily Cof-like phosphohydrolase